MEDRDYRYCMRYIIDSGLCTWDGKMCIEPQQKCEIYVKEWQECFMKHRQQQLGEDNKNGK